MRRIPITSRMLSVGLVCLGFLSEASAQTADLFKDKVAPILEARCLSCHNEQILAGGLSLQTRSAAIQGGESGEVIVPENPDGSYLLDLITPSKAKAEMPKQADPLSAQEVALIRQWILDGAKWPEDVKLRSSRVADLNWWSLRPLSKPALPELTPTEKAWVQTPIDAFIAAKQREHQLQPATLADRRTLIRRLSYDLTGLPPGPEEVAAFIADESPHAYEVLVDRLLASPAYGEHWARHWLDVVHYADTHGYDKDKPRPNAWPYRDYIVRAFNEDKPYSRFVTEQIAGDVLWPQMQDAIAATGFLAAGPWDFIGHVEVPEGKIDGKIARHLDRDDMVTTTLNTFASLTAQCARCHHHKFDPITMEDYYSLQAVFAAIDRADRPLPLTGEWASRQRDLQDRQSELQANREALHQEALKQAGPVLTTLDDQLKKLNQGNLLPARPEFGYHSAISQDQNATKWVQIDLGEPCRLEAIVIVACHDDFNNIGAGFGFPLGYKIELSNDPDFGDNVVVICDHTGADVKNPGTSPQCFAVESTEAARHLRITATKLATRQNDYIFALGEVLAFDENGRNLAQGRLVSALDSIEAPVRWQRQNLVDGRYFAQRENDDLTKLARLDIAKAALLNKSVTEELRRQGTAIENELETIRQDLASLPKPGFVYATTTSFPAEGQFKSTNGIPREVTLLARGDVTRPGPVMSPGTVPLFPGVKSRFELPKGQAEGERRKALADWLVHHDNPLTWRSLVNRVWLYHFGRGLVDSPNDFGRGGQTPSDPELLDWLAADFRDNGESLKRLHRIICLSATYRQSSTSQAGFAEKDANNVFLWRMNRRRLSAEEIRDSVLLASGRLRMEMGGPGFQDFLVEKPEHSPHYEYEKANPDDARGHRRAIYRFIVRSQPQPMMTVLDCADPAFSVPKRDETLTPLQSLSLMNNPFMLWSAEAFAARLANDSNVLDEQIPLAFRLLLGRSPTSEEFEDMAEFAKLYGLPATCRVMMNLNEFVFVD